MAWTGPPLRGRYRTVWWSVTAPLTVLGTACAFLLLGAGGALLVTTMVSAATAVGIAQLAPATPAGRPPGRLPVLGLLGGLWALAFVGLTGELGGAGFLVCVLVAAAGALPGWTRRPPGAGASRSATPPIAGGSALERLPDDPLPALSAVRALSTAEVCWAWRLSYLRVQRRDCPGYALDDLAALRRACLDELERRDPVAFRRWLPTARAAGDPARVFCRQPQQG